jgi:hypothetical protein
MFCDTFFHFSRFTIIIWYILSFDEGVGVGGFVYRLHSPVYMVMKGLRRWRDNNAIYF